MSCSDALLTQRSAREEMRRLSEKYPNGIDDFKDVVPQESSPPTAVFPVEADVNERGWTIQTEETKPARFGNTIKV